MVLCDPYAVNFLTTSAIKILQVSLVLIGVINNH